MLNVFERVRLWAEAMNESLLRVLLGWERLGFRKKGIWRDGEEHRQEQRKDSRMKIRHEINRSLRSHRQQIAHDLYSTLVLRLSIASEGKDGREEF